MDIAVVVNLNSRRGSERFAEWARRLLPSSKVIATRTAEDVKRFVDEAVATKKVPRLVLSGGGDGTAIGLLDALRAKGVSFPTLGLVPLGTGNAWAFSTQAPSPKRALEAMQRLLERGDTQVPTSEYSLLEIEGRLTPFADAGWGAEILHDYKEQRHQAMALKRVVEGRLGYFASLFGRTIPRNVMMRERPRVRLVNLGDTAFTFDPHGNVVEVPNAGPGTVLYEGPYGVAGAGTTMELGFGMKALHFARTKPGHMHARVYAATAAQATLQIPNIWNGVHPIPHSHDFLLTRCRMEFDREVPVEVGGDIIGLRREVEYRVAPLVVPVLDWSRLQHARA